MLGRISGFLRSSRNGNHIRHSVSYETAEELLGQGHIVLSPQPFLLKVGASHLFKLAVCKDYVFWVGHRHKF